MRPFAYEAPADAASAVALAFVPASAHVTAPVQYKGGGTTLIDLMKLDVMQPTTVVDITAINDEAMHRIVRTDEELRIGSLVSMAELQADPSMVRDYPLLTESLWQAASQQLRNMARLGGNVLQRTRCSYFRDTSYGQCNKRAPGSGCAALDGVQPRPRGAGHERALHRALCRRLGTRAHSARRTGGGAGLVRRAYASPSLTCTACPVRRPHVETSLAPGELITAFIIPGGPRRRSLYRKVRDRESYAFANASAAVALDLDGDVLRDVRIGLGGVATIPWRARRAEALLRGRTLNEAAAAAAATAEFADAQPREHNSYKVALGQATMVRALLDAQAMEIS